MWRALVEQIAKSLVDEPDQVSESQLEGDVLELTVAPNDVGKVIGIAKAGLPALCVTLIGAAGIRIARKRFTLEISLE